MMQRTVYWIAKNRRLFKSVEEFNIGQIIHCFYGSWSRYEDRRGGNSTKTSRRQLGVSIKAADNQFSCQCSNLCCCAPLYAHGQLSSQRFRTKVPLLFSSLRAFLNFTTFTTIGWSKGRRKLSQLCWQKWDQKSGFHCHFIEFKFTPMLASTFALAFLTMGFIFGQSHFFSF